MAGMEPNLFELKGYEGSAISYSATSVTGSPEFSYTDSEGQTHSFSGEEISLLDTELGQEVTVVVRAVADSDRTTLTLLVPPISLGDSGSAQVNTLAVVTTQTGSIGGPPEGQQYTYRTVLYAGEALFAES